MCRPRIFAWFERADVVDAIPDAVLPFGPSRLPSRNRGMAPYLVPLAEVPEDAWIDGRLEHLDETIKLYSERPNSPTVTAFLHFDSDSPIRVGSHVTLGHSTSEWCVLAARRDRFELIRNEPKRPTKVSVNRSDVRTHRWPATHGSRPACRGGLGPV